jgi:hypothetical protein
VLFQNLKFHSFYKEAEDAHLDADLISVYKFLIKSNDLYEGLKEMIKFIGGLQDIYLSDLKDAFKHI